MSEGIQGAVLIVDDTPANLVAFEAVLAPLGRPLITARSGEEALELLQVHAVALIVLDIQMPGLGGFETAARIRASETSREVAIIFITARDLDDADIVTGYQLGGSDLLTKPIRADVLQAKARVFLALHDRTEQLRLANRRANERAQELEQQRAADRDKDRFLAILGHELRNPLAAITTAIDLVERAPADPVPDSVRRILGRQVRQLRRLVDDLLDISRFSVGKISLERAPVSVADVIDSAVAASRALIDERHHQLVLDPPSRPILVEGDVVRLVQVVSNLLVNAAKYTPPGGRIDLAWGIDDRGTFIRVRDTGRGLPPELLQTIFDMFVQERADADGSGGLGVGLALVRRLVMLHGGTARAESAGPGLGSTFEVLLPVAPPGLVGRASTRIAALVAVKRSLRTLVVDDQEDLRDLVAELLVRNGHDVMTACDGPSALATIAREHPDAALIDIGLPGMDGYELARAIRAAGGVRTRLVAMTGYGQDLDRLRVVDAGFDLHIIKPASAEVILRALQGDVASVPSDVVA
jgi:signal transduction histidine kinase